MNRDAWGHIQTNTNSLIDQADDPKVVARKAKVNALRERGISIPGSARADLAKDIPSSRTRGWSWWSHIWSRPSHSAWEGYESGLEDARQSWDASETFVTNQDEIRAGMEARRAEAQAVREAEVAAERAKELEAVTANLRHRYLAAPGATAEGFEKALPELLEQRAREAALSDDELVNSPLSSRQMWG